MPLTTNFILHYLVYGASELSAHYDGRRQVYELKHVDGSHVGIVSEGVVRAMVTDGSIMNDRFNMDDETIIYRVTLRGVELAPTMRPPSFPTLARGDMRKALQEVAS